MSRIVVREHGAPATLIVALPHDPSSSDGTVHWWRITGDEAESGVGDDWIALAKAERLRVIGLAPAALIRLAFLDPAEGVTSPRQAVTIARVNALDHSLGDPETLHTASVALGGEQPTMVTAVAANAKMQEWLDWAERHAIDLHHIVPAAMVLPLGDDWTAVSIGTERLVGRKGMVLTDEPALTDALLGEGEHPIEMDPREVHSALARIADTPRPDLRSGRFARRRRIVLDRTRVRELVLLALALLMVTTVIAIVEVLKLDSSRRSLDSETLQIARAAAGPGVTLETAEATLAARAGQAAGGGLSAGVAAVLVRLQNEQNVSLSALGYSGGTLSFTVSGQGPDAINRVLLALQRDGYQVTAVPRTQANGQTLAEVTLGDGL